MLKYLKYSPNLAVVNLNSVSPTTPLEYFPILELDNLRSLQSQGGIVFSESNNSSEQEEFVDLGTIMSWFPLTNSITRGFIKTVNQTDGNIYNLQLNGGHEKGRAKEFNTNPARNDRIPSSEDYQVGFTSSKPNRVKAIRSKVKNLPDAEGGLFYIFLNLLILNDWREKWEMIQRPLIIGECHCILVSI